MRQPLSGSTLLQMVTAAGGSAAFMAAIPNADAHHITLYFLLIGGTRIVLGAADALHHQTVLAGEFVILPRHRFDVARE
jgi:hypothetical protein